MTKPKRMKSRSKAPAARPEQRWRCTNCETDWTDEEPGSLRECSSDQCGSTFVAEFGENNCDSCGRPFTRNLADHACADCQEEMEESEGFTCENTACPTGQWHEVPEPEPVDTNLPEWNLPADASEKQEKDYDKRLRKEETRRQREAEAAALEATLACGTANLEVITAKAEPDASLKAMDTKDEVKPAEKDEPEPQAIPKAPVLFTETICGFKVHPAAALMPEPSAEEFEHLLEDVRQHGVREPGRLLDGTLLDGRSRCRVCAMLDIPFPTVAVETDDPVAYVLSLNAVRRHLTPAQVAAVHLLANQMKVEQQKSEAAAVQTAGLRRGDKSRERTVALTGKTATKIAKATGVSTRTVETVQKVQRVAPERLLDVAHGKVTPAAVLRQAEVDKHRDDVVMGTPRYVSLEVLAAGAKKPTTVILNGKDWSLKAARERFLAAIKLEFDQHSCCREDRPALAKMLRQLAADIDAGTHELAVWDKYGPPNPNYASQSADRAIPTIIAGAIEAAS